jgi:hypothetical protein
VVVLGYTPTSASLVVAYDANYNNVSANISSVVPGSSNVTINFVAAFSGSIQVFLTLANSVFSNAQLQPVSIATMPTTPVTGTFWQATQPVSGTITATGALTNNNAAPAATFLGVLPAIAETAYATVTYTTGNMVLPVTDLHGAFNTDLQAVAGTAIVAAAAGIQKVGISGNAGATLDSTIGAATAPTNAQAVSSVYQTTVPALTAGQAVAQQCDTTGAVWVNKDSRRSTYRATSGSITPVAAATDPIMTLIGSSTKTIRVTHIHVEVSAATGVALPSTVTIQRLSALTGGTAVAHTALPLDSNNAAATAVMDTYTTVPTSTTVVANSDSRFINWVTQSATVANTIGVCDFTFGDDGGQQFVLRGTSQWLSMLVSAIGTTPVMTITVEWVEDNS